MKLKNVFKPECRNIFKDMNLSEHFQSLVERLNLINSHVITTSEMLREFIEFAGEKLISHPEFRGNDEMLRSLKIGFRKNFDDIFLDLEDLKREIEKMASAILERVDED